MALIGYTTSHSLHAKVYYEEGMLTVKLSGCVSGAGFRAVAAYAAQRAASRPWTVVVYDMLGAIMLADAQNVALDSALTRIGRPGAYLITDDMVGTWRTVCWRLGQQGVERRVFTSGDAAFGWARLRALQIAAHSTRARARALEARALEAAAQLAQVVQERSL
jgi:hypothetical protein